MLLAFQLIAFVWFGYSSGEKCGKPVSTSRLTGKIVGGYDVGYYKYPWFAALLLDGEPWCGGTLISSKIVLTAAHCYRDYLDQSGTKLEDVYTIKLGVYNSCQEEPTQKEFKVAKVQVHENYRKEQSYYDIALITLDQSAEEFEPVCLPQTALKDNTRGKEGIIIGLGTTEHGTQKYPCQLHEGRVLIFSDKTCRSMIKNVTTDKGDYALKNAFCAGYKNGGIDSCQGDSGGPLLITSGDTYYILGLTSFGYDCAKANMPSVYTDVSHYLDWIKQKAGIKATDPIIQNSQTTEISQSSQSSASNYPSRNTSMIPFPIQALLMYPPKRIIIEFKRTSKNFKHPKGKVRRPKKVKAKHQRRHRKKN